MHEYELLNVFWLKAILFSDASFVKNVMAEFRMISNKPGNYLESYPKFDTVFSCTKNFFFRS